MFNAAMACALALSLSNPIQIASDPRRLGNLEPAQVEVLTDAKKTSGELDWRLLNTQVDGRSRSVVILGEVHLAQPQDLARANRVIDQFEFFATENGSTNNDPEWSYLTTPVASVMVMPHYLYLVFAKKKLLDSPMVHAKSGARVRTVQSVERLHTPSWSEEISLLTITGVSLIPFFYGGAALLLLVRVVGRRQIAKPAGQFVRTVAILGVTGGAAIGFNVAADTPLVSGRDVSMAKFIDQWVKGADGARGPLFVIVGKNHNPGIVKLLTEQYDFTEQAIAPLPLPQPNRS